jgi:hypothetical protein
MAAVSKQDRIDEIVQNVQGALRRDSLFEAERMSMKALVIAHQICDYQRMAVIVPLMNDARQRRWQQALAHESITIVLEQVTENYEFAAGCYLVQPPQVGADARRLRMAALQSEVPVAVICREPTTQLGLCPIVAIGPGVTIRTKIDLPADADTPDMDWFLSAFDALGQEAVDTIDLEAEVTRRIKQLLEVLDAVPECEPLHQLLEKTCQEAAAQIEAKPAARKSTAKSKAKT